METFWSAVSIFILESRRIKSSWHFEIEKINRENKNLSRKGNYKISNRFAKKMYIYIYRIEYIEFFIRETRIYATVKEQVFLEMFDFDAVDKSREACYYI